MSQLKEELAKQQAAAASAQAEVSQLKEELATQQTAAAAAGELTSAQAEVSQLQEELATQQAAAEAAQVELSQLKEESATHQTAAAVVQAEMSQLTKKESVTQQEAAVATDVAIGEARAGCPAIDEEDSWSMSSWIRSLSLHVPVESALQVPDGTNPLQFVRSLDSRKLEALLADADLLGLRPYLEKGVVAMQETHATAPELNRKFQYESSFTLEFGTLDRFYSGLTGLVGPVRQIDGSILQAMEHEHCKETDCDEEFESSNGVTTRSALEWEFVMAPVDGKNYPDRFEPGDSRCRRTRKWEETLSLMKAKNAVLSENGYSELIEEETIAATLYTGPMYEKYNLVLRAKTGVAFLKKRFDKLCKGNVYSSTLHGINSSIVKLSKITEACTLWRGSTKATLPESFTKKDNWNLRGGIEFGFTSMTKVRAQALHYAEGAASTVFQARQGLTDRGAEMMWISQYPHEAEILFSPLLGLEMIGTSVDHGSLLVDLRLSLNLTAETLDQIKSKRQTLMRDTAANVELEILAAAEDQQFPGPFAALALAASKAYLSSHDAQWYNDDGNLLLCMKKLMAIKEDVQKLADQKGEELLKALGGFIAERPECCDFLSKLDVRGHIDGVKKLPEDLFGFTKLAELNLGFTKHDCSSLQALPESLGQFSAIQELNFANCDVLRALPDSLGQLSKLQKLDLCGCRALQALLENVGQLSALQELSLDRCYALKALPESVGKLSALQKLSLQECRDLQALPESLGRLAALQELNLAYCHTLQSLPESLGRLAALQELNLAWCKALQSLPESLGRLSALRTLYLYGCNALRAVPKSLGRLSALKMLDLSGCPARGALPESLGQLAALKVVRDSIRQ